MIYKSPHAPIFIDADDEGITLLTFNPTTEIPTEKPSKKTQKHLQLATQQLDDYFSGIRKTFDLPIHYTYGTEFQKKVWHALLQIPYGQTKTYLDIAIAVHSPKAVRAIGQANKLNPVAIIIPCHRVIGKNGALTGYMGSGELGLDIKRNLLKLEGINL